jgi:diacylglycerol kinase
VLLLVREEKNARLHALAAAVVIVVGLWVGLAVTEWALIALTIAAVWGAEAANSAVERLADVVCPERHPGIGATKDLAAASVLLVSLGALVVGALVFGSHLWR